MHPARTVQEQIWRIDDAQPVTHARPMQEWVHQFVSVERFSAGLLLGFALIGYSSCETRIKVPDHDWHSDQTDRAGA